jgi:two-component system sensor histidine kinase KdpD
LKLNLFQANLKKQLYKYLHYIVPELGKRWLGLLSWMLTWLLLWFCDGILNLGNQALLLVLGSAMAGMWLPTSVSLIACVCSMLAFNWLFVPPRFTFNVDLNQDLMLLFTMLCVSAMISYLMSRLRSVAKVESEQAASSERMRSLGELFRDTQDVRSQGELLRKALEQDVTASVTLLLLQDFPATDSREQHYWLGETNRQIVEGLLNCVKEFVPLGPGTGRFENQRVLFLPVRGRTKAMGAVAIRRNKITEISEIQHTQLQQMCDMLGLEIERDHTLKQAQLLKEEAHNQSLRNTLLTSISHDYRTPLANLISAASVIHSQNLKLNSEQITRLSNTVLIEAQHLNRMTSNTLQLARLDSAPWRVHKDWESLQEIIGSVLSKTRLRYPMRQLHVQVSHSLPLIFCDAMLLVQMFDNLIENAIKYSADESLIDIQADLQKSKLLLRVVDRGRGVPDNWKEKVFRAFERIHEDTALADATDNSQLRRGVGIGLAVCTAIANVHDARIWIEDTLPQGATLCVEFPLEAQPVLNFSATES